MPIPTPDPEEDKNDFVARCMEQISDEYDQSQAAAICYSAWDDRKKSMKSKSLFDLFEGVKAFCPTGEGGGVDPSCGGGSSGGGKFSPYGASEDVSGMIRDIHGQEGWSGKIKDKVRGILNDVIDSLDVSKEDKDVLRGYSEDLDHAFSDRTDGQEADQRIEAILYAFNDDISAIEPSRR